MAYSEGIAAYICLTRGKRFISRFHKIMSEGRDSPDFALYCIEMQACWEDVRDIRLKPRSEPIAADNLVNWFFTAGSCTETKIKEEYQDVYETLILSLLSNRDEACVKDILDALIGRPDIQQNKVKDQFFCI